MELLVENANCVKYRPVTLLGFPKESLGNKQVLLVSRTSCLSGSVGTLLFVGCLVSVYGNERDAWAKDEKSCHLYSVQFSCSVVSDSLRPHGLQHTRVLCPSPAPGACSNSYPLSQ